MGVSRSRRERDRTRKGTEGKAHRLKVRARLPPARAMRNRAHISRRVTRRRHRGARRRTHGTAASAALHTRAKKAKNAPFESPPRVRRRRALRCAPKTAHITAPAGRDRRAPHRAERGGIGAAAVLGLGGGCGRRQYLPSRRQPHPAFARFCPRICLCCLLLVCCCGTGFTL